MNTDELIALAEKYADASHDWFLRKHSDRYDLKLTDAAIWQVMTIDLISVVCSERPDIAKELLVERWSGRVSEEYGAGEIAANALPDEVVS